MKIEKLPSGSYRVKKMYKGKVYRITVPYKPTQKEAIKLLADKMGEQNDIILRACPTVEQCYIKAIEEKSKLVKKNTTRKYSLDFKRYISDEFKSMQIQEVRYKFLKDYTTNIIIDNKFNDKAFLNYKSLLNLIFDWAIENEFIEYSIVSRLKTSEFLKICVHPAKNTFDKAMSKEQIDALTDEVESRIEKWEKRKEVYMNGYIFLLSKNTGMRAGELVALKMEDIKDNAIHIHAQQISERDEKEKKNVYTYLNSTKNEKGISRNGRYFPITDEIRKILNRLEKAKNEANYQSEYLFCNAKGEWIHAEASYEKFLLNASRKLGYTIGNNHAIRMYVNSYVLIPAGITVTNRAKLLGHSVKVNLYNYSFEDHDYIDAALKALSKSDS